MSPASKVRGKCAHVQIVLAELRERSREMNTLSQDLSPLQQKAGHSQAEANGPFAVGRRQTSKCDTHLDVRMHLSLHKTPHLDRATSLPCGARGGVTVRP